MGKIYKSNFPLIAGVLFLTVLLASCKKDVAPTPTPTPVPVVVPPKPIAVLGLYELQSTMYRRVFIGVSVGTVKKVYYSVFDTGSSAMTMDATDLIPAADMNANGFIIPGDSLVVNGITITKQTAILAYGDNTEGTKEYGNLAYATLTIGDEDGSVNTKRVPFFLYYKAVDSKTNKPLDPHSNDVFGVGPYNRFSNLSIASPLSYFTLPDNVTQGFKLAKFDLASYSTNGTLVKDLLTIGLVPDDLSSSSGFIMHPLTLTTSGYSPNIPASITYNGKTIQGTLLFDTGTPAFSNVEDPNAAANTTTLPDSSMVTINTTSGFSYTYTVVLTKTNSYNLTQIEKPSFTGDDRTIFSIDFFNDNQFLLDYTHHKIGLKN